MAQALVRKLDDETLEDYRLAAKAKGSSLEAELREVIEAHRPSRDKDRETLGQLARRLQAMTPDGEDIVDSTLIIRWDRDTHHGRWTDDGWADERLERHVRR